MVKYSAALERCGAKVDWLVLTRWVIWLGVMRSSLSHLRRKKSHKLRRDPGSL